MIPNHVKQDKFELLTWAGMNRIRMGIQSGSRRTLDFYTRPSPPEKILAAGVVNASFAPKVIPNTELERKLRELGVDIEEISATFMAIPARVNNLLLSTLTFWRPPRWLWKRLLTRVRTSTEQQQLYPRLGRVLRGMYLTRRALSHLVKLDFSATPRRTGYYAWRIGLIGLSRKRLTRRLPRPPRPEREIAREQRAGKLAA